jgi:hypothetical protein
MHALCSSESKPAIPSTNPLIVKLKAAFENHPRESVISLLALEISSIGCVYQALVAFDVQFSPEV